MNGIWDAESRISLRHVSDQRYTQVLHVSPTTITFDLQYHVKKPERLSGNTQLGGSLQLRIFMVANQNAIQRSWDISQKAQDNKEKIQALEHYLECHQQLWSLCMEEKTTWLDLVNRCHHNRRMNLLLQKVNLSSPITE